MSETTSQQNTVFDEVLRDAQVLVNNTSHARKKTITVSPEVCGGKPCIRGLRFPVSRLLGLLAAEETPESILKAYPYLEREDITEALRYAATPTLT